MSHYFSFFRWSRRACSVTALTLGTFHLPYAWAQAVGTVQQDRRATLQASQGRTSVPPVAYRSVFIDLSQGVESTSLDWKAANANVGQFKRGHVDLLKWEQEQAAKARTAPANTTGKAATGGKP